MRNLDIPKTAEQISAFIKTTVQTAGFSDVVIAVSGGVDSATSASLAVRALGAAHVHALLLPYNDWHAEAVAHARLLLGKLKVPDAQIHEVNIGPMVDGFIHQLGLPTNLSEPEKMRLGNAMARIRMITLFDFAKKLPALVLGTENLSEHYLGYFTRFGDEASDIEPIRNLYKTEVFALAKYLGVPEEILTKAPTAGLWAGQTDEGQFGFSYAQADLVLYSIYNEGKSEVTGIPQEVVTKVKKWVESVDFKHHLPHVGPKPVIFTP